MPALIHYYFKEFNSFNPLLHRPTFERHVAEGIHLSDEGFGATLLLVCALGARFSDDPRAFSASARNPQDAGMQWFNQVQATLRVINHEPPRLYDLQIASVRLVPMSKNVISLSPRVSPPPAFFHVLARPQRPPDVMACLRTWDSQRPGSRRTS